ncbi:uncharacterized protein LOC135098451 [Scylla paramamosain]|uniref:uncharacterized protein LOC135098451 n=1 Tax=Scylla paramamosain TaxID=85552 RepID=UPI003082BB33
MTSVPPPRPPQPFPANQLEAFPQHCSDWSVGANQHARSDYLLPDSWVSQGSVEVNAWLDLTSHDPLRYPGSSVTQCVAPGEAKSDVIFGGDQKSDAVFNGSLKSEMESLFSLETALQPQDIFALDAPKCRNSDLTTATEAQHLFTARYSLPNAAAAAAAADCHTRVKTPAEGVISEADLTTGTAQHLFTARYSAPNAAAAAADCHTRVKTPAEGVLTDTAAYTSNGVASARTPSALNTLDSAEMGQGSLSRSPEAAHTSLRSLHSPAPPLTSAAAVQSFPSGGAGISPHRSVNSAAVDPGSRGESGNTSISPLTSAHAPSPLASLDSPNVGSTSRPEQFMASVKESAYPANTAQCMNAAALPESAARRLIQCLDDIMTECDFLDDDERRYALEIPGRHTEESSRKEMYLETQADGGNSTTPPPTLLDLGTGALFPPPHPPHPPHPPPGFSTEHPYYYDSYGPARDAGSQGYDVTIYTSSFCLTDQHKLEDSLVQTVVHGTHSNTVS